MKAHFSKWIAHYAGVLAGVCAVLAGMDLSPLGKFGIALTGAASTGVIVAHALGVQPTKIAAALTPFLCAGLLLGLNGCATVQQAVSNPQIVQVAADAAVGAAEQAGATPAQIYSAAKQLLAADQGASATLQTLTAAINAQLAKLNLNAAEQGAITGVEIGFDAYLLQKYGSNPTVQQTQVEIADFLNAVLAAPGVSPAAVTGSGATTQTVVPLSQPAAPVAKSTALSAVVSPPVLGAAASAVLVACLNAFTRVSVSAPTAAAITVLFTFGNAYLGL